MNYLEKPLTVCLRQRKAFSTVFANQVRTIADAEPKQPEEHSPIIGRNLQFCPKHLKPRQVWVENLDEIKEKKKGLVDLHPKIFATMPRLDLIYDNIRWQNLYGNVIVYSARVTPEMSGGGRKPWQQKGLGKARQGSIRAPQFLGGGTCHGPRNPTSYYYKIPYSLRVHGLTSTLSAKFAQDDIHVVENLDIPSEDSQYMLDLIKERNWGPSVLFVDVNDIMPRNITVATENIGHVNLLPVYGLNVYGMLKHVTLVLTLEAVEEIEKHLLKILHSANPLELNKELSSTYKK